MPTRAATPATPTYMELVADALLVQPELLETAQGTAVHWRRLGAQPTAWLDTWDEILTEARTSAAGMARLQEILRAKDATSERLREFAPLSGILPREIRRGARDQCGYRH